MSNRNGNRAWLAAGTFAAAVGIVTLASSQGGKINTSIPPTVRNTQIDILIGQVAELQKEVAALKGSLQQTQADFNVVRDGLRQTVSALKPPAGYSSAMITKSNFSRIPDTALIKYFARN